MGEALITVSSREMLIVLLLDPDGPLWLGSRFHSLSGLSLDEGLEHLDGLLYLHSHFLLPALLTVCLLVLTLAPTSSTGRMAGEVRDFVREDSLVIAEVEQASAVANWKKNHLPCSTRRYHI